MALEDLRFGCIVTRSYGIHSYNRISFTLQIFSKLSLVPAVLMEENGTSVHHERSTLEASVVSGGCVLVCRR